MPAIILQKIIYGRVRSRQALTEVSDVAMRLSLGSFSEDGLWGTCILGRSSIYAPLFQSGVSRHRSARCGRAPGPAGLSLGESACRVGFPAALRVNLLPRACRAVARTRAG